ncbi:L-rhamnose-binding lectin CSL2-like [Carassius carassius]|uniref:L-rhamnose-binding lectin CSL2-like n=1 Tax=Carassius carassius TaxID=217509 RepID=UPI0028686E02|nr:L-rhamnose-binding lectin CSL2-like [Carassius carassius]
MYQYTMLIEKRSGITLLLLLCQHACFLSASYQIRKSVTCEGQSASLSCDSGFIHVLVANYGRIDGRICSAGQRLESLSNVHCFQKTSLHIMTTRCNGKKSCSVQAVNSVFSDPCYGTYKYLIVSYECRPLKHSITCESSESVIVCDKGVIAVHHANYGRRDVAPCPAKTSDCFYPQTASISSRCNGKRSCTLTASNSVFSDPCVGVYKYLEVTYSCKLVLLLLLCQHGQSASLSCDSGFIHVLVANYGRNDGRICSAGQRLEWLSNVHCFQKTSLHIMTTRCNGKKSCSVQAVNSVFSDPCYGTYKYLQVSYECHPLKHSITCESSETVIVCGKNHLKGLCYPYV